MDRQEHHQEEQTFTGDRGLLLVDIQSSVLLPLYLGDPGPLLAPSATYHFTMEAITSCMDYITSPLILDITVG